MTRSGPISLRVVAAAQGDVFGDMARVHQAHRPFSQAGEVIIVRVARKRIAVVARGAMKNDVSSISLDLRNRQKLGLKPNETASFMFEKAGFWDHLLWAWNATDAMPRIAARLGVISVALGGLGLLLGLLSVWLTVHN